MLAPIHPMPISRERVPPRTGVLARLLIGTLILAVIAATPNASAQTMSLGLAGEVRQPTIGRSDLAVFVRVLELDETETGVLHDLHAAFYQEYMSSQRVMRRRVADAAEEAEALGKPKLVHDSFNYQTEWRKHAEELEKAFLDDVTVMLTAEQDARWPIVERELRRLKTMSRGRLIGESIDLNRLIEAEIPAEHIDDTIEEILERYAVQLDAVLIRRNRFLDENTSVMRGALTEDPERSLDIWERGTRIRAAVRDTNERYLRELIAAFDEASDGVLGGRLRAAFDRQACSRYTGTPSRIYQMLESVPNHAQLSAAQRPKVEAVLRAYRDESAALDARECAVRREWELTIVPEFIVKAMDTSGEDLGMSFFDGRHEGADPNTPLGRIRLERLEVDRAYRDRVRELLSEDQWYAVPDTARGNASFTNLDYPWPEL